MSAKKKPTTVRLLSELLTRGVVVPSGPLGVYSLVLEIPNETQPVVLTIDKRVMGRIQALLEQELANAISK